MEKELKDITLVTINCDCPDEGIKALRYSKKDISFGRVLLLSSKEYDLSDIESVQIENLDSIYKYNDFMLGLVQYIDTPYVLVVQSDGYVVNAKMWTDEFLDYDYIGAPWPNDPRWLSDQNEHKRPTIEKAIKNNRIGNGGFSLRSHKFLEYASSFNDCNGWGEDIYLCSMHHEDAQMFGIKFPSIDLAYNFSYENRCSEFGHDYREPHLFDINQHFGFHNCNFVNEKELLSLKNGI